jgi:hypothetical protein
MAHFLTLAKVPKHVGVGTAVNYLKGGPQRYWFAMEPSLRAQGRDPTDWEVFRACMVQGFGAVDPEVTARHKIYAPRQGEGSGEEYARHLQMLFADLSTGPMSEADKLFVFFRGMRAALADRVSLNHQGERWATFAAEAAQCAIQVDTLLTTLPTPTTLPPAPAQRCSSGSKVTRSGTSVPSAASCGACCPPGPARAPWAAQPARAALVPAAAAAAAAAAGGAEEQQPVVAAVVAGCNTPLVVRDTGQCTAPGAVAGAASQEPLVQQSGTERVGNPVDLALLAGLQPCVVAGTKLCRRGRRHPPPSGPCCTVCTSRAASCSADSQFAARWRDHTRVCRAMDEQAVRGDGGGGSSGGV